MTSIAFGVRRSLSNHVTQVVHGKPKHKAVEAARFEQMRNINHSVTCSKPLTENKHQTVDLDRR